MSDKFENAKCSHCPLKKEPSGVPSGPDQSTLILVGDFPTITETMFKTPLAGQAGELLKNILGQLHIEFDKVHITYAAICRNPAAVTTSTELTCCRDRLVDEVTLCKPILIVPMGEVALHQILRKKEPLNTHAGKRFWSPEFNCSIIPVIHPSAVMKSPKIFTDFVNQWQEVKKFLDNPTYDDKPIDLRTRYDILSPKHLPDFIEFLKKQPIISCDLETTGFSPISNRAFSAAFAWKEGYAAIFDEEIMYNKECIPLLKQLWEMEGPRWLWHNGKFDVKFLRHLGINARVDEDTMLLHYLLDERKGIHDLDLLSAQILGAPNYKAKFKKLVDGFEDYSAAPRAELLQYTAHDVDYVFRIFKVFDQKVRTEDQLHFAYTEVLIPASNALADFELEGAAIDMKYMAKISEEYTEHIATVKETLLGIADMVGWNPIKYQQHVGTKKPPPVFNPGSWQQLGYVLHHLLKMPKYKGSTTTDADAVEYWLTKILKKPSDKAIEATPELLTEWEARGNANLLINRLAEHRKITKLFSTYIEGLQEQVEVDKKVHTSFLIHGTSTGRLASRGPNVQNIPRGKLIKTAFIPTGNNIFIQADYSQCIAEDTWVSDDFRIQDHPEAIYKGESPTSILTTERGYNVECTKDHQIATSTGWKPLSEIQQGDWIALQGESFEEEVFNPFWWVVGFWVGDGSFHNSKGTLQFSKKLPVDEEQIALLIAQGISEIPRDYGSYTLNVTNQAGLVKRLHSMFDKRSLRIPFNKITANGLSDFLSGLFDADASIDANGIEFSSRFELLSRDVQLALLRFGIMSTLITTRTGYNYVEGGALQYKVHICDAVSLRNFQMNIGFQLSRKQQILQLVNTRARRDQSNYLPIPVALIRNVKRIDYRKYVLNHLNGRPYTRNKIQDLCLDEDEELQKNISWYKQFHWDQVKEIVSSGREAKVYDLMDQPNNRFSANGVIVHNCELRVLAVLAKCPDMMKLYYDGKDLHDEVSLELYGPGYTKNQRVRAKAFNFGKQQCRSKTLLNTVKAFERSTPSKGQRRAQSLKDKAFRACRDLL